MKTQTMTSQATTPMIQDPDSQPMTFQDLILTLQNYWADKGCVILQPYDMEVGAGTFHTATFLRSLALECCLCTALTSSN